MSRQYRPPRRSSTSRVPDRCQSCGTKYPPSQLYFYVDGNNESITRNSPALCETCYKARYGKAA
jgi:hypothetical protein